MSAIKARPAEATGGLGAAATAIAALTGASTTAVAIVGTIAGLIPGIVTYVVSHGGVRGIVTSIWRGRG